MRRGMFWPGVRWRANGDAPYLAGPLDEGNAMMKSAISLNVSAFNRSCSMETARLRAGILNRECKRNQSVQDPMWGHRLQSKANAAKMILIVFLQFNLNWQACTPSGREPRAAVLRVNRSVDLNRSSPVRDLTR
jgi:hypothetical protein